MVNISITKNIMVPMRDGVRLATDIIRMEGVDPQPVLMARTPYNKDIWTLDNLQFFDIFRAAQTGYVVVVQDSRGRFASEGDFTPMLQEREDGVDAIAWAASQPWSNGMVGLFGASYVGTTQWLPAQAHPAALKAIAPMITYSDLYDGMMYHGGVMHTHGLGWTLTMVPETARRQTGKLPLELLQLDMDAALSHMPLNDQPSIKEFAPYYWEWLSHPTPDEYWKASSPNTLHGDGLLSTEIPVEEPPDSFLYNPLRPIPTIGGQVLMMGGNVMGPRDQQIVEVREDVLVYSSAVLDRPVEVTGPVQLELYVASSARDTDFTGKLVDVYPDGRAIILTEGILRARYHKSLMEPELLDPVCIYKLQIDLWATSNIFLSGHRIRLEVSSSNFPRFARNTNTGGDIHNEGPNQCIPAINRVFHSAEHPSHLILPIIER